MARAAKILHERGYDVIDLNFACPVKKIKNKARGGHMLKDVARGIADKMVARHPHVFGDAEARSAEEQTLEVRQPPAWERSPSRPSTTRIDRMAARYSVSQSAGVAGTTRSFSARTVWSPRTSQPASIRASTSPGS